jgi:hypothetical protein
MIAAVPQEILENEHTVAALPEAVAAYARMHETLCSKCRKTCPTSSHPPGWARGRNQCFPEGGRRETSRLF